MGESEQVPQKARVRILGSPDDLRLSPPVVETLTRLTVQLRNHLRVNACGGTPLPASMGHLPGGVRDRLT